jgi:4-amino-4-deoxy-L-arabinose transferase-like glycosyltransferase
VGGPKHVSARPARPWLAPAVIVLVALLVRAAVVVADDGYVPANDSFQYDGMARSIAAGDGYPQSPLLLQGGATAFRGPTYPFLLGGVYAVSGDSVTAGRLAGAALGALTVLLVYLIARRIWSRRVGLVAAGMTAVFPPLVLLSRELLSESVFLVLMLAAVLCVLSFRASGAAPRWAAVAGVVCGLAVLTRNVGVVLILPVALGVWTLRPRLSGQAALAPLLVVLCAALVVAPWALRNAIEFGRFIPVTSSVGYTPAGTYNEASYRDSDAHAAWRNPQLVPGYSALFVTQGVDEGTVDATLRREARQFAWDHPAYVAEASGWNLLRVFEIVGGSVVNQKGQEVYQRGIGSEVPSAERVGLGLAAVLALLGILAIVRPRWGADATAAPSARIPRGPWFLWMIPVLMVLVTVPLNGLPRYRLPADPFLLMLSAVGLTWIWDRLASARERAG